MPLGFNSNAQLGRTLYHVQTEDRGVEHPFIDTVVLLRGQVLHRRSTSYEDLVTEGAADPSLLRARVETQHREVLDALQSGTLPLGDIQAAGAIEVRLRNPASWLSAGQASLELQVCTRGDGRPVAGAEVRAQMEGVGATPLRIAARTDAEGRARLEFPLPATPKPAEAVLTIQANAENQGHELRFRLKPRPGTRPPR